ncbi:hypothetical protein BT93_L2217 [Corymbia citriodora subsp. variegata]|uniref:Uncharacterized protein n=1 Tax=Corymbia citriodora subsp. variegata TaxID=360336 RepID=A0A8T0CKS9_CORYI|nr:hypothetical protein BT93_L2217 [Corymbia citriodora subsp. variegata]
MVQSFSNIDTCLWHTHNDMLVHRSLCCSTSNRSTGAQRKFAIQPVSYLSIALQVGKANAEKWEG